MIHLFWLIPLLVLASIFLARRYYKFSFDQKLAEEDADRLRTLDEFKNQLYTNITHEFRTPLTVIMGVADQIEGNAGQKALIKRNSENLLKLVNQILDLSKLETGSLELNIERSDVIAYLKYVAESFDSFARSNDVELTVLSEEDELLMDFDKEKLQHIASNLLSNAVKFTPPGGKIVFQIKQARQTGHPFLQINVRDSGKGIAAGELPFIFDRFYQVDDSSTRRHGGTGVGLALVRELVNLMGGRVEVESEVGKGSVFKVFLPITRVAPISDVMPPAEMPTRVNELRKDTEEERQSEHPILLLIEDNADVVSYIKSCLKEAYNVVVARNGQEGIDKALETVPDIIISDVMMPEKDGFEVCETLKRDERTSHIPIILLTAKATIDDKISGLKTGADAYLTKPFHKEELFVRLEKLLELRKQLQARYGAFSLDNLTPGKPSPKPLEDAFIRKLKSAVLDNLDNAGLSVPDLCKAVHLSHMQVYRKLKALTDKTPSQFIRSIRLLKGLELLRATDLNVSEIAYDVGFSDPNYFSRAFQKEFGRSPSSVRE